MKTAAAFRHALTASRVAARFAAGKATAGSLAADPKVKQYLDYGKKTLDKFKMDVSEVAWQSQLKQLADVGKRLDGALENAMKGMDDKAARKVWDALASFQQLAEKGEELLPDNMKPRRTVDVKPAKAEAFISRAKEQLADLQKALGS